MDFCDKEVKDWLDRYISYQESLAQMFKDHLRLPLVAKTYQTNADMLKTIRKTLGELHNV